MEMNNLTPQHILWLNTKQHCWVDESEEIVFVEKPSLAASMKNRKIRPKPLPTKEKKVRFKSGKRKKKQNLEHLYYGEQPARNFFKQREDAL